MSTGKLNLKFKSVKSLEEQLQQAKDKIEELEDRIEELKEHLEDESSPKRVGWWENRCFEAALKIWKLEQRNDRIIELLTEDQVEELKRLDAEDEDDE
jgi:septal ring factor EnvC (AmiA/AmiB activator)